VRVITVRHIFVLKNAPDPTPLMAYPFFNIYDYSMVILFKSILYYNIIVDKNNMSLIYFNAVGEPW